MKYSIEFIRRTPIEILEFTTENYSANIKLTITIDAPEMMAALDKATEVLKHELGIQADKSYELNDIERIA